MRYYVNIIENTINGENRTVPKAYDDKQSALSYYHKTMGNDMASEQILGAIAQVFDSDNGVVVFDSFGTMDKYVKPEPEPEVVEEEATTEA